jgi:NADH-quinone oxidoreductase subunit M
MNFPFLTVLTLVPLAGAILVALINNDHKQAARKIGLGISLITLGLAVAIWAQFNSALPGMQFVERHAWIPALGVDYHLSIDGIGLLMIMLATIVVPFAMLASWRIQQSVKLYFSLFLFLEAGLIGTFTALNFFHWFIFWELSLIPAFFLIKLWGGPQRTAAAYQFFLYTLVGSVAMLLSFLAINAATGVWDFTQLAELAKSGELQDKLSARFGGGTFSTETLSILLFLGVFLGFAVKVPLIPFHTWLPATYTEAPTGTSMVLTGVMSKMGVYGFLRILLPIFPDQINAVLTPLLWLAVATIVFSAFAAFAQKDLKRMVAYSSINHLGYCVLGIFAAAHISAAGDNATLEKAAALNGVILQMFNHGLTASALFCFVGFIEQRSGGLRGIDDFGGLRKIAPVFCGLMGITLFSSLGLPGLNGFVGEFLIFKGAFPLVSWAAVISTIGLLVTAVFLLTILQRVFSGPLKKEWAGWKDLTLSERLIVAPMIILMFVLGIYPQLVIAVINPTVLQMVKNL